MKSNIYLVLDQVPEVIYQVLEDPANENEIQSVLEIPQTLEDFIAEMKDERPDAKTFALKLKSMVVLCINCLYKLIPFSINSFLCISCR